MLYLAKNMAFSVFCIHSGLLACNPSADESIRFDVTMPPQISIKKKLEYSISLTNVSAKPVLVPDYILGGVYENMGIFYWYQLYDESGKNFFPPYIIEYSFDPRAFKNKPFTLLPGETRSEKDWWPTERFFAGKPGRYRIVFHWQGFEDGNEKGVASQFSCERWIEVTE
jgi:hypothetical protein